MRTILVLCMFFPIWCAGQETAFWSTTFYFEDAVGNKDTMVVGHDPAADSAIINPQLGEVEVTDPWDATFEVRAAHSSSYFSSTPTWLNKVIGIVELQNFQDILEEYNCYLIQEWYYVAIYAKHKPVTITWDRSVFENNFCKVRSTLSNHNAGLFFNNWGEGEEHLLDISTCLAEDSVFVTDLVGCCNQGDMEHTVMLEDGSMDIVNGLFFQFGSSGTGSNHCNTTFIVDTKEIEATKNILVYPNPTAGIIRFEDGMKRNFQIFNINGMLIKSGFGNEINLYTFPSGIYTVHYFQNSKMWSERVVKI